MLVFDGHNDTLTHLYREEGGRASSFFERHPMGHLDAPRAREGSLAGGLFAIFTPPPSTAPDANPAYGFQFTADGYRQTLHAPIDPVYAKAFTDSVIGFAQAVESESKGTVRIVRDAGDLDACLDDQILAMVLHLEGAEAIHEDLSNLEEYYRRGVRAIGPVWSRPNRFGCGVHFEFPHSPDTGPGMTTSGMELVRACNRLGILIDLAHITEKGFWDAAAISDAPLVVSHADVHALCPSTRNLTDAQLEAIGASHGLVGINFEPFNTSFPRDRAGDRSIVDLLEDLKRVPLTEIVRHIDYVANKIGIDCVAFGSDFDGADMPNELGDAAGLPRLIDALARAGYDSLSIEKIAYRNWLRVLQATWHSG